MGVLSGARCVLIATGVLLSGCSTSTSTLDTAGTDATNIARLFWWMTGTAGVIWVAMVALVWYCARGPRPANAGAIAPWLIVGGGVVLPSILLAVLLAFSLPPLAHLLSRPEGDAMVIDVSGEQWWWRVTYVTPSGNRVELANEVRLPLGQRVTVRLSSRDVIHSFWIPSLAGKVDMIPGRTTHLALEPQRTGLFRGICAEYCGTSHALMAFPVAVIDAVDFNTWLNQQSQPARTPVEPAAVRGANQFMANGCGACHAIRGTSSAGVIGPDLTHIGSRLSLAAGTLPNDAEHLVKWMAAPDRIKPDTHMPAFDMLDARDLHDMATYLGGLQ